METYYTTKLTWLTGDKLESAPCSAEEARKDLRRLRKNQAVKKVVMRKYTVTFETVARWKRMKGK